MVSIEIKCCLVISKIFLLALPSIALADGCIERYPEKYGFGNSFYTSKEVNSFLITDKDKYECFRGRYEVPDLEGSKSFRRFPVICRGNKNIFLKGVDNPKIPYDAKPKTEFKHWIRLLANKHPFSAKVICNENHPNRFKRSYDPNICYPESEELICTSDKSIFRVRKKFKLIGFKKEFTLLQERIFSISNKNQ